MKLESSWYEVLKEEISKPYIAELKEFLASESRQNREVYPPEPLVFSAFLHTPFPLVKAVIVGQDPYHGPRQAHGLSFSVPPGVPMPPSLKNIFLELKEDLGVPIPEHGCLEGWAKQGVLLLNALLTVRAGEPHSHRNRGWERFTDAVIAKLVEREDPLVFILWGKTAQEKMVPILQNRKTPHVVLTAAHPSPYSAHSGFFGCRHFSKINAHLIQWGKAPIAY